MTEGTGISPKMLQEMMGHFAVALAQAIREGNKDPIAEDRKRRAKARGEEEARQRDESRRRREEACSHMFPFPYANCTRIAWQVYSDGIERGFCPICGGLFVPGHEAYERMKRLPRHPLEAQPSSVGMTY